MKRNALVLIKNIEEQLLAHYKDPILANQYAWWMLEELTQQNKINLVIQNEVTLSHPQEKKLAQWIYAQVIEHEPLAYLIGWVPFLGCKIFCSPPTLIPRPETEEWCEELINLLRTSHALAKACADRKDERITTILDLATGSGCIAIALAKAFPRAQIIATDIADSALELAQKNAAANKITNISFIKSDVYAQLTTPISFDLIVSNPPYIAPEEWESLDSSVSRWEDPKALAAPDHGLAIIKEIINGAHIRLKKNSSQNMPRLVIEIGYLQGPIVKELMEQAGFARVEIKKDLAGKDRTVWGY